MGNLNSPGIEPSLTKIAGVFVETGCDFPAEDSLSPLQNTQPPQEVPFPWRVPVSKFKVPPVSQSVKSAIYRPKY